MNFEQTVSILKQSSIFEGLSDEALDKVAAGCVEQEFPMGTLIIEENDLPKNTLYFVKSGELTVSTGKVGEDGHASDESIVTTLGPGDAFGEITLVDQMPHSATVRTMSDSEIFLLSASFLNAVCEQDTNIGYHIFKNIAKLICHRLRLSNFSTKHFWIPEIDMQD